LIDTYSIFFGIRLVQSLTNKIKYVYSVSVVGKTLCDICNWTINSESRQSLSKALLIKFMGVCTAHVGMKQTTLNLNAAREVNKGRVCFLSIVSAVKHKLFDVDGRLLTIDTIFKESDKLLSLGESVTFELLNVQVK